VSRETCLQTNLKMFKEVSNRIVTERRTRNAVNVLSVPKKPLKEVFKLWLKDKAINFCNVTSLHGYVHTVNKDYHPFERWLWLITSFLALVTAIVLLWISWNWTAETPTTTVIESTNYPTYNLPFPAVTICNMNKISKESALDIAKTM
jgi:Amiloride-sensitive sodium channel